MDASVQNFVAHDKEPNNKIEEQLGWFKMFNIFALNDSEESIIQK